jgi:DNA-binding MarR family transcriptional regulator
LARFVLRTALMNTVDFAIKQAHFTALRFSRRDAARVDLTPARVDMLRTILVGGDSKGISQSYLRRLLNVSAPNVSVMVRALEELRFVERVRHPDDRRTLLVSLTDRGKLALRMIELLHNVEGHARLMLACIFSPTSGTPQRGWSKAVAEFRGKLDEFRRRLHSKPFNPWDFVEHQEDFYDEDVPENPIRIDFTPVDWDDDFFVDHTVMQDILMEKLANRSGLFDPDHI